MMNSRKGREPKEFVSCSLSRRIHCFLTSVVADVHVWQELFTGGWNRLRSYLWSVTFIIELEHKEVQTLTFHFGNIIKTRFRHRGFNRDPPCILIWNHLGNDILFPIQPQPLPLFVCGLWETGLIICLKFY